MDELIKTGDKTYAATKAGYNSPAQNGSRVASRPAVDQEIRARTMAMLHNEGVPLAVGTLMMIASTDKAPWNARVAASKEILAAADRHYQQDNAGKEPHEMTSEELAARLQQAAAQVQALETIAADRARPVEDVEPSSIDDDQGIFG